MITTSMLQKQVWLVDGEFDHIGKNSQRLLGLSAQYESNPMLKNLQNSVVLLFFMEHTF